MKIPYQTLKNQVAIDELKEEFKREREETAAVLELHRMRMKDFQEEISTLDKALGDALREEPLREPAPERATIITDIMSLQDDLEVAFERIKDVRSQAEDYTDNVIRRTAYSIDRVIESEAESRIREDARIRGSIEDLQNAYDLLVDRVAALEEKRENVIEVEIPEYDFGKGVVANLKEQIRVKPLKVEEPKALAPGEYRVPYTGHEGLVHGEWKGFVRVGEPFLVRDTRGEPMVRYEHGAWAFVGDYSHYDVPTEFFNEENTKNVPDITPEMALAVLREHARGLGEKRRGVVEAHLAQVDAWVRMP